MAAFEKYRSVYTHDELMDLKGRYYETFTAQDAQAKEALL